MNSEGTGGLVDFCVMISDRWMTETHTWMLPLLRMCLSSSSHDLGSFRHPASVEPEGIRGILYLLQSAIILARIPWSRPWVKSKMPTDRWHRFTYFEVSIRRCAYLQKQPWTDYHEYDQQQSFEICTSAPKNQAHVDAQGFLVPALSFWGGWSSFKMSPSGMEWFVSNC